MKHSAEESVADDFCCKSELLQLINLVTTVQKPAQYEHL